MLPGFQSCCVLSYQQPLNVKMFAGSQTKLWGDSVSTDGALFCSVATALTHADFHAAICRLLPGTRESLQDKLLVIPLFTQRRPPEHIVHAVVQRCLVCSYSEK